MERTSQFPRMQRALYLYSRVRPERYNIWFRAGYGIWSPGLVGGNGGVDEVAETVFRFIEAGWFLERVQMPPGLHLPLMRVDTSSRGALYESLQRGFNAWERARKIVMDGCKMFCCYCGKEEYSKPGQYVPEGWLWGLWDNAWIDDKNVNGGFVIAACSAHCAAHFWQMGPGDISDTPPYPLVDLEGEVDDSDAEDEEEEDDDDDDENDDEDVEEGNLSP